MLLDKEKQSGKTVDCLWGYSFILLNSIGLYGKLSSCLADGEDAVTSTDTKSVQHSYLWWIVGAIIITNFPENKCVEKP